MARSRGYRPKAAVRAEIVALRARLSELHEYEWQKANMIMENITSLLGHSGGPSGGHIAPRACRYCRYYGHTKQWCPKRERDLAIGEERQRDKLLEEDRKYFASVTACVDPELKYLADYWTELSVRAAELDLDEAAHVEWYAANSKTHGLTTAEKREWARGQLERPKTCPGSADDGSTA